MIAQILESCFDIFSGEGHTAGTVHSVLSELPHAVTQYQKHDSCDVKED